ncbi:MAG: hypothetical protein MJE77_03000 [Proteobacteria bacterium]|nr:hypothetical protein [Pseudomonadota bacterium]
MVSSAAMAIRIVEIHAAEKPDALNTEWFIVENNGQRPFSTRNCSLTVSVKGKKKRTQLGTMEPGFTLAPGQKVRVITGNPGRKAHGKAPEDDVQNYNLFLNASVLRGGGTVLTLALRSLPITKATYDPDAETGIADGK